MEEAQVHTYTSGHGEWRLYSEIDGFLLSISQAALAGRIAPTSGHCFDDLRQASPSRMQDQDLGETGTSYLSWRSCRHNHYDWWRREESKREH